MARKIKAPARNATHSVAGGEQRPARNATLNKDFAKPLTEMDSDEILDTFGHSVAGGEKKKNKKMLVSGKGVFTLVKIIGNKAEKRRS